MIRLSAGLSNSLVVLEHLKRYVDDLEGIDIRIGAFTNCRECGLTFIVSNENTGEHFTYCIYEHRNSDQIIINGKESMIDMAGDLPYMEGTKYDYIEAFPYNAHYECAEYLKDSIVAFAKTKHKAGKNAR
jgi:hypothetical protein